MTFKAHQSNSDSLDILVYLEPRIELNNPLFRYPTLRNSLRPQIEALQAAGHRTVLVTGEAVARRAVQDGHLPRLGPCTVLADENLRRIDSSRGTASGRMHQHIGPSEAAARMAELVMRDLPAGFSPQVVMSWESPVDFVSTAWPNALVIQQMPGLFSRPPFPELVAFDSGLLERSALNDPAFLSSVQTLHGDAQQGLETLRSRLDRALRDFSPVSEMVRGWRRRFSRLVLLPLQIDGYFMIDQPLGAGRTQFDLLVETLAAVPAEVGVVVTQYVSRNVSTGLFTPENLAYLRDRFPNFIHDPSFDTIPYVSQYLARELDGTMTISSSLGYQAAFWRKPVLAFGPSHVSRFASAPDLEGFLSQVGAGSAADRDALIHAALSRLHPSMAGHIQRRGWLARHIEALAAHHADGRLARGLWPEIEPADELYRTLSTCLREDEIADKAFFAAARQAPERHDFCVELSAQIARKPVVSFDVFDTLLQRPFAHPSDLFEFISPEAARIADVPFLDFKIERRAAERDAFEAAIANGRGETTIDEIYVQLARRLDIDSEAAATIKQLEMDTEARLLYRRESGYRAYKEALALGRRVILVSDMYLPASFLEKVLARNGFAGYERLYVSSESGQKKHSGRLYDLVLADLKVKADDVLHVGDNVEADVSQAKSRGIKPFHLPKAWDRFVASDAYKAVWARDEARHSTDWRAVLALVANRLHANPYRTPVPGTQFSGRAHDLGYAGFGPVLLGLAQWIADSAKRAGHSRLYFLARDGRVMKEAYDRIARLDPDAPPSSYLLCSRRAVNVAKLRSTGDVLDLLHVDFAKTRLAMLMETRFGLSESELDSAALARHGFKPDSIVSQDDRGQLSALFRDIAPAILASAQTERALYLDYLGEQGLRGPGRPAVVDIGYAGTMQQSLSEILDGRALGGLYLMTFRPALKRLRDRGLAASGWLGDFIDRHDTHHPFCRNVPLWETLFSSPDTSFVRFTRDWRGDRTAVFQALMPGEARRIDVVRDIQEGALAFVENAAATFGSDLARLDVEPAKALRALTHLFAEPSALDARIFLGVRFEDAYGGAGIKEILPAEDSLVRGNCVWAKGREAIVRESSKAPSPTLPLQAAVPTQVPAEPSVPDAPHSAPTLVRAVHWYADRFLTPRKRDKLRRNPERFFADAGGPTRWIGALYLRAGTV